MPTDDVLERVADWFNRSQYVERKTTELLISDLAAEVRELRRDRERLEFALRCGPLLLVTTDAKGLLRQSWDVEDRSEIDAAMKGGG